MSTETRSSIFANAPSQYYKIAFVTGSALCLRTLDDVMVATALARIAESFHSDALAMSVVFGCPRALMR